ncbi:winged helix-turn-helix transcriptional regulator [bacterium]|nr:winged helix-turn-helix transcriptional regulator [bacterium]
MILISSFYSAIGDEITYRIALLLARYRLSVKEIVAALDLEQPHVSHKLAKLRKYGCVINTREGRSVYYELQHPCRDILLSGDKLWRNLRPAYETKWDEDLARLKKIVGKLEDREHSNSVKRD